jgi:hypothetical protein
MPKMGIEELKSVILLVLNSTELGFALADGVDFGDLPEGLAAVKAFGPGLAALKSGLVIPEIKDLDDVEKAELKMFVGEEFDIDEDTIEVAIEKVLSIAIDFSDLLKLRSGV